MAHSTPLHNFMYILTLLSVQHCRPVRVILGQALSTAICGSRTRTEVTACDLMPNLLTTGPLRTFAAWSKGGQLLLLSIFLLLLILLATPFAWIGLYNYL